MHHQPSPRCKIFTNTLKFHSSTSKAAQEANSIEQVPCWFTSSLLFPANFKAPEMSCISETKLRDLYAKIQDLKEQVEEAKHLVEVLEAKLKATRRSDTNTGNPGEANDGLKEGRTRVTLVENERGRFVKWTTGPILFPAAEFAEKMGLDVESFWAENGPGGQKTTEDKATKEGDWEIV
ncbi:hypothetical protein F25303_11756 [Fusarium sp. NRRL 25303]|nr:hypothetical protein F25303_11756 [Fusarium sp. NRRL 25303]